MVCDISKDAPMCPVLTVLILILLEYGLRHVDYVLRTYYPVLILILLEYGLRLSDESKVEIQNESLNPYSIGIWSATLLNKDGKPYGKVS